LANRLMEEGFLVLLGQEKILRLVPPLIVTKAEIDAVLDALENNI
ncbi:MAG: aspartate aminotransferase family protein, partial [Deltaproteobacteria bacterium]|nr:aspartate aminotransferase family protein [Deltaproteobacteria bacterium]